MTTSRQQRYLTRTARSSTRSTPRRSGTVRAPGRRAESTCRSPRTISAAVPRPSTDRCWRPSTRSPDSRRRSSTTTSTAETWLTPAGCG